MKSTIAEKIYQTYEDKNSSWFRSHLGASLVGLACERAVWLQFRWAGKERFSGRMLRLFETGKREEQRILDNLSLAGLEVKSFDHASGKQFNYQLLGGHFGGSLDGIVKGVPEFPDEEFVLEAKTHNVKSFNELEKKGVREAKPEHHAQCMVYMGMSGLKRALYFGVCKDDDRIHTEIVEFDEATFKQIVERAKRIIFAERPPARIATNPDFWQCKFCSFRDLCHGLNGTLPSEANCRTCLHSTPELDGSWSCAFWDKSIDDRKQRQGCSEHLYIPDLVKKKQVDVGAEGIEYDGGLVNIRGGSWKKI